MDDFFNWLLNQAIAIVALMMSIVLLIQNRRLRLHLKRYELSLALSKPISGGILQAPHLIHFEQEGERTHAIRNQKLVNHISLYFRNQGETLYYDNIEFEERNKRQEVEILAEKELEIFTDSRDSQKVEMGESLKISFEREIGESMNYQFNIFFQDKEGILYFQTIKGEKGSSPAVGEPQKAAPF